MENIKIDFDRDDSEGKNTSLIDISVKSMTNENVKTKESEANKTQKIVLDLMLVT